MKKAQYTRKRLMIVLACSLVIVTFLSLLIDTNVTTSGFILSVLFVGIAIDSIWKIISLIYKNV